MDRALVADRRVRRAAAASRLRLAAGVGIPVAMYLVLQAALRNETTALAITEIVPVAWVLAMGIRRRRLDPVALIAAIVLGVALAISIAMGGSALPLKLRRAVVTGSLGIACLISVTVRRPLLPPVIELCARAWPQSERLARAVRGDSAHHKWLVLTTIVGVTLVCDSAAQLTLALSVSTATFVGVAKLARTAIFAVGLGICGLYARRTSAREPAIREDIAPEDGILSASAVGQAEA